MDQRVSRNPYEREEDPIGFFSWEMLAQSFFSCYLLAYGTACNSIMNLDCAPARVLVSMTQWVDAQTDMNSCSKEAYRKGINDAVRGEPPRDEDALPIAEWVYAVDEEGRRKKAKQLLTSTRGRNDGE